MNEWTERKGAMLSRLRRIEGQVRAVAGMVEREEDCERIAQQMAAARKALDRAFYEMMACATGMELDKAGVGDRKLAQRLEHLTELLSRYG